MSSTYGIVVQLLAYSNHDCIRSVQKIFSMKYGPAFCKRFLLLCWRAIFINCSRKGSHLGSQKIKGKKNLNSEKSPMTKSTFSPELTQCIRLVHQLDAYIFGYHANRQVVSGSHVKQTFVIISTLCFSFLS